MTRKGKTPQKLAMEVKQPPRKEKEKISVFSAEIIIHFHHKSNPKTKC